MLSENQLNALMADIESDRAERTVSTNDTDKFGQAICAFANDLPNHRRPGYLLVGVKDSGMLAGTTVTDDLLKNLAAIRSDGNILPQPMMHVSKFSLQGGDVAVVEVHPSDLPPVRYKGRVHIRVGPRKAIANEQEERILSERRVAQAKSFDAQPCTESKIGDLALGQFDSYRREAVNAETIAANHRPIEQQLASLRLYDPERGCATHAGILLIGKNPRFYLPGAYVQFLQLPSISLTDLPSDQAEISGDLHSILKELEGRLKLLVKTSMVKTSALEEKLHPNYPERALRELLMNAVMHRNYNSNAPIRFYAFSDHIEIQSPGSLYGEATRENFPTRNSYRNPVVAEALKYLGSLCITLARLWQSDRDGLQGAFLQPIAGLLAKKATQQTARVRLITDRRELCRGSLGYVNRFGYGVQRAQALLAENGNPPASFEFDEHSVLVKIQSRVV